MSKSGDLTPVLPKPPRLEIFDPNFREHAAPRPRRVLPGDGKSVFARFSTRFVTDGAFIKYAAAASRKIASERELNFKAD